MSRIRQFFKTSESDKDDCLIITPSPTDEEPNEKNRKCSAKSRSKSPIKDKKKDKLQHLKASKSDLAAKNTHHRAAANQSHFYLVINSEDADQERRLQIIIDQTLEGERTGRRTGDAGRAQRTLFGLAKNLEKNLNQDLKSGGLGNQCTVTLQSLNERCCADSAGSQSQNMGGSAIENLNKVTPDRHIYQNERLILAEPDERPALPAGQTTKKTSARSSFTPKPLKMIKKRLRKKSKEFDDQSNDRSNGGQPAVVENAQNSPPPNSQPQSNSQINQQPAVSPPQQRSAQHLLNPNVSLTASGQGRRRQNQSFENLDERLEYISQTAGRKPKKELMLREELKPGYKSEDNLLHTVPSVPRSLSKMSANEQQFLKKVEESLTSHHSKVDHRSHLGDLSSSLQFFSENPSYTPFERPERVSESQLTDRQVDQQPVYYVNEDPRMLDALRSRRRKAELISLRQLKPRHFLVPKLTVTDSTEDSKELIYVNLQFNDDQSPDESNDCSTPASDSPADGRKSTGSMRIESSTKADLVKADLSKSTDLELLRSNKPSKIKQSKSDDESRSKVEYCKIDFMATESLKNLRTIRIQNHHHLS